MTALKDQHRTSLEELQARHETALTAARAEEKTHTTQAMQDVSDIHAKLTELEDRISCQAQVVLSQEDVLIGKNNEIELSKRHILDQKTSITELNETIVNLENEVKETNEKVRLSRAEIVELQTQLLSEQSVNKERTGQLQEKELFLQQVYFLLIYMYKNTCYHTDMTSFELLLI